jgi:N-acyl-L-homoserine lactone synthetase
MYCLEHKFLNPTQFPEGRESDEYDKHSTHIAAINRNGDIIGLVRLIHAYVTTLPTEKSHNLAEIISHIKKSGVVEISRLIIDSKYRKTFLFLDLLKFVFNYSKSHDINYWIGSIEEGFYNYLKKAFGFFPLFEERKFIYNTWNYSFLIDLVKFEETFKHDNRILYYIFKNRLVDKFF